MTAWLTMLADLIFDADAEIGGCGGQYEAQDRLKALLKEIKPLLPTLPAHLKAERASDRAEAAGAVEALAHGRFDGYDMLRGFEPQVDECLLQTTSLVQLLAEVDPEPAVRAAATKALIALELDDLTAVLKARLEDPAPEVQDLALDWLSHKGERATVPLLLRRLAEPPSTVNAAQWSQRVGLTDCAEAAPLLAQALARSDSEDVRRHAADALVEFATPDRAALLGDVLAGALRHGDYGSFHAAMALARCPMPAATVALRAALESEASGLYPGVRTHFRDFVVRGLVGLGDATIEPRLNELLGPLKTKPEFGTPWPAERIATLAMLEGSHARDLVYQALAVPYTQRTAVLALAAKPGHLERDIERVKRLLHRPPDIYFRRAAGVALAMLSPDIVDGELDSALQDLWGTRNGTWDDASLAMILAAERLWQSLPSRGRLSALAARRVERLGQCLVNMGKSIDEGILCYRGRGGTSSLVDGAVFAVRDHWSKLDCPLPLG